MKQGEYLFKRSRTRKPKFKRELQGERAYMLLPGQYYDAETNTHYNYSRDYDPSIGR